MEQSGFEYMGVEEVNFWFSTHFVLLGVVREYMLDTPKKFNSFLGAWVVIAYVEILYMRVLPT